MKNEQQQQQARNLFFQTSLTKTQIAQVLNVNRRTIYEWSVQGNWERIKKSAANLPCILAEKCYFLIGHFTDHLLSRTNTGGALSRSEVESIYKLTLSINRLKKGSSVNENMEAFTYFLESIERKDPELAHKVVPYFDAYIRTRKDFTETSFLPEDYTLDGFKKPMFTEQYEAEKQADAQDLEDMLRHLDTYAKEEVPVPAPAAQNTRHQPDLEDLQAMFTHLETLTKDLPPTAGPSPERPATPGQQQPNISNTTPENETPPETMTGGEMLQQLDLIMHDLHTQYPHLRNLDPRTTTNPQYPPRAA